jgi:hypothetical protein
MHCPKTTQSEPMWLAGPRPTLHPLDQLHGPLFVTPFAPRGPRTNLTKRSGWRRVRLQIRNPSRPSASSFAKADGRTDDIGLTPAQGLSDAAVATAFLPLNRTHRDDAAASQRTDFIFV